MMMERGQNSDPASDPVPVIYPSRLIFHKKSPGNYSITDDNNNIILEVMPFHRAFRRQLVLIGADNNIKLLLRKEFWSCHGRWNAYSGRSTANLDLLFSIKKARMTHSKTDLLMSLANKQRGDFKIKGNWPTTNCSIYMGDCLMAQMKRMEFIKDKFTVTIYPNVDCASVVSVFAIIVTMNSSPDENHYLLERVCDEAHMAQALRGVAEGVGVAAEVSGLSEFVSFFQG